MRSWRSWGADVERLARVVQELNTSFGLVVVV
jgi:hypothetical protein